MAELQDKYDQLLAAYSQLKAKNSVLKNAVREAAQQAQSNGSDQSGMEAKLRAKDQRLRDASSEVDTLTFRNTQLTKRVELLQAELEKKQSKSKSSKKGAQNEEVQLLQEEAMRLVAENAALHQQLDKVQSNAKQESSQARTAVRSTKMELEKARAEAKLSYEALLGQSDELKDERNDLRLRVSRLEEQLAEANNTARKLEGQLNEHTKLQREAATAMVAEKQHQEGVLNVTSNLAFNRYNIHVVNTHAVGLLQALHTDCTQHVLNIITHWAEAYSYLDQHVQAMQPVYQVPSSVLLQLTNTFAAKAHDFKPLSSALSQLSIEANQPVQLAVFASAFKQAATFIDKASAAHAAYLTAESESEQCTPSIRSISTVLEQHHQAVAAAMHVMVGTLDTMSDPAQPSKQRETSLQLLPSQLDALTTALKGLCSASSSKSSMETRLPNAPTSDDLVASSLSKAVVALERLTQRLGSQSFLLSGLSFASSGVPGSALHPGGLATASCAQGEDSILATRAGDFMAKLQLEESDEVVFVPGQSTGDSASEAQQEETGKLESECQRLNQALDKLQHEKEQALLDVELLKLRVPKEGSAVSSSPSSNASTIGCQLSEADLKREALIRQHFSSRVAQLTTQLQYADSKAVMFHDECRALVLKLARQNDDMKDSKSSQHGTIRPLKQRIELLEAELDQTRVGYEEQIQTLTEALASLTDQVAQRQDELDALHTTNSSRRRSKR